MLHKLFPFLIWLPLAKKSWKDDRNRIDSHILPAWKNTPISAITKNDVSKLHKKIGGRAVYEANRTLALIKRMFNLAIEWELLEPPVNPAIGIKPFREIKRDRWLNPEEVSRLLKALQKEKNIYARSAFWLYLLTGLRKTELLTVKWDDIDITRAELRLPDTKSGKSHYLPLSKPAIEILSHIPKIDGNPFVLVGLKKESHLVNISKAWYRVKKNAEIENVRLHDLRRTVGSWLAQSGKSLHLIGSILNHQDQKTTQVYAHFHQDNTRDALEELGESIIASTE